VLLASGEFAERDIGIVGTRIVSVAEDLTAPGELSLDLTGKTIVPGYVEPHSHALGPLSVGTYCGEAIVHGTACLMTDDSFVHRFMSAAQYGPMLDISSSLPLVLRWSLRLDRPRTLPLEDVARLIDREDVAQLGELMTRPLMDDLPADVAELIALARMRGMRIEGHSPGASPRTLGVAAAAGVSADHEARRGDELTERLRAGLWGFIRHTDLLRDAPAILAEARERGLSLERTAFTADWSLPPWIAEQGIIDAVIRAALAGGMAPEQAYACASWRPAAYMRLDAHVGMIAPGRLASVNVLHDVDEPRPERVFGLGRELARDGRLTVEVPEVDWQALDAPSWSLAHGCPPVETFTARAADPLVSLESASMVRPGAGEDATRPIACLAIDPVAQSFTRAGIHGMPESLEAIVSTLTPKGLLLALGADPAAIARCVDAVIGLGGGIAYQHNGELRCLALPVAGVITTAPCVDVARFWLDAKELFAGLGHPLPDPLSTLFHLGSSGLPGARFTAAGLIDTRRGELIEGARALA
jgi:adenine deaminase